MKKVLLCCTDLMMKQFMIPHVQYLSTNGFVIDVACSNVGGKIKELKYKLSDSVRDFYTVRLVRNPFSISNLKGYRDLKRIIDRDNYDLIWTNEPVMGVMTRIAARKARERGTKVIYMVHGFHFYEGAPLPNWLIYYTVEKLCSRYCDEIVTINSEDYHHAQAFHVSNVRKISGVGVNLENFSPDKDVRALYREKIAIKDHEVLLLNVAELTKRKNQHVILEAIYRLRNTHIKLIICGVGKEEKRLKRQVKRFGLQQQVLFLGYRNDIPELCCAADIFVLTSLQEGLPRAIMEAMASGLPVVCSSIRGNKDLIENGKSGYTVKNDAKSVAKAINRLVKNTSLRKKMGWYNTVVVKRYSEERAKEDILKIMQEIL